jgi:hypothetical protein
MEQELIEEIYLCLGGLKLFTLLMECPNLQSTEVQNAPDADLPSSRRRKRKRKKRSCYARPWILRRKEYGHYHTLLQELAEQDPPSFKGFTRIDVDIYNDLLERVGPIKITEENHQFQGTYLSRIAAVNHRRITRVGHIN